MRLLNEFSSTVSTPTLAMIIPLVGVLSACGSKPTKPIVAPSAPVIPAQPLEILKDYPAGVLEGKDYGVVERDADDNLIHDKDPRRNVFVEESKYDPVVSVNVAGGGCTGTISEVFGYKVLDDDLLVPLTAHCFFDVDGNLDSDALIVGTYKPRGSAEVKTYSITTGIDDLWIDPKYKYSSTDDLAFIRVPKEVLPADVKPAILHPIDLINYQGNSEVIVESYGYNGDRFGLTTHEDCKVLGLDANGGIVSNDGVYSDCEIFYGASGGGLAFERDNRLNVVAFNSFSERCESGAYCASFHSVASPKKLDTIPFLERKEGCAYISSKGTTRMQQNLHGQGYSPSLRLEPGVEINVSYSFTDVAENADRGIRDHGWVRAEAFTSMNYKPNVKGYVPAGSFTFEPCAPR